MTPARVVVPFPASRLKPCSPSFNAPGLDLAKIEQQQAETTALNAFIGAVQALGIFAGLFFFATKVQASIGSQALPSGYTARNISVTVRTIVQGLVYLATFIFGANGFGLLGLSIQLLLFPDSIKEMESLEDDKPKGPQLPKVGITSTPDEIRAAFEMAEQMGKSSLRSDSDSVGDDSKSSGAA